MNETELFAANRPAVPEYPAAAKAEARARLTAAATGRARHGRRRALAVLAPLGATAVIAAPVLVVVLGGTSSPARAVVAAAAGRTGTQSFRVTGTIQGSGGAPIRSEGVFDTRRRLGRMVSYDPQGPTEIIIVNDDEYVKITHTNYMKRPDYQPYRGKPWIRYPRGTFGSDEAGPITRAEADPQQALAYLREATNVRSEGKASGPGWTGHGYAFTVSPRITTTVSINGVARTQTYTVAMTGTVTIDTHRRVRRLELLKPEGADAWIRGTLVFTDYGIPVSVTAPPADQIATEPSEPSEPSGPAGTPGPRVTKQS